MKEKLALSSFFMVVDVAELVRSNRRVFEISFAAMENDIGFLEVAAMIS
jgi:hypothetical protein